MLTLTICKLQNPAERSCGFICYASSSCLQSRQDPTAWMEFGARGKSELVPSNNIHSNSPFKLFNGANFTHISGYILGYWSLKLPRDGHSIQFLDSLAIGVAWTATFWRSDYCFYIDRRSSSTTILMEWFICYRAGSTLPTKSYFPPAISCANVNSAGSSWVSAPQYIAFWQDWLNTNWIEHAKQICDLFQ